MSGSCLVRNTIDTQGGGRVGAGRACKSCVGEVPSYKLVRLMHNQGAGLRLAASNHSALSPRHKFCPFPHIVALILMYDCSPCQPVPHGLITPLRHNSTPPLQAIAPPPQPGAG